MQAAMLGWCLPSVNTIPAGDLRIKSSPSSSEERVDEIQREDMEKKIIVGLGVENAARF
jgi:hypothetical protein